VVQNRDRETIAAVSSYETAMAQKLDAKNLSLSVWTSTQIWAFIKLENSIYR
jgi:hypothetical protein